MTKAGEKNILRATDFPNDMFDVTWDYLLELSKHIQPMINEAKLKKITNENGIFIKGLWM